MQFMLRSWSPLDQQIMRLGLSIEVIVVHVAEVMFFTELSRRESRRLEFCSNRRTNK
jgi:hypothetical protein